MMSRSSILLAAFCFQALSSTLYDSAEREWRTPEQLSRKVEYISDGTPPEELVTVDGQLYVEVKELVPADGGRFLMKTRLLPYRRQEVQGERPTVAPVEVEVEPVGEVVVDDEPRRTEAVFQPFQPLPVERREPLDPRAQWYIPGGQPEFPKLIYSPDHGWKELQEEEEEEIRRLRVSYTAPRGLPGLRWIEVPYGPNVPQLRTKVAIPSSFVPVKGDLEAESEGAESEGAEGELEVVRQVMRSSLAEFHGGEIEIPKNKPEDTAEIEIPKEEPQDTEEDRTKEAEEASEDGRAEEPKMATFAFGNLTTTAKTREEEIEKTAEDEKIDSETDETTGEKPKGDATLAGVAGDVNYIQEGDLGAVVSSGGGEESEEFLPSVLGQLVAAKTDTCAPIAVRGREGQPLYWVVRALPCASNPTERAKVLTTEDGQSYAYYGQPELVSLRN